MAFVDADATKMSFEQFLTELEKSEAFRDWLTAVLREAGPDAYFWELPPIRDWQLGREFEMAIVEAQPLARAKANPRAFAEHFKKGERVAVFANTGGDATLIAPAPTAATAWYAHLGVFLRSAPRVQVQALWEAVARAAREKLSGEPLWISTSGLGVPWLHVRLDSAPKYYSYKPFTRA